jgi:DNA-binding response OmpR family regulator
VPPKSDTVLVVDDDAGFQALVEAVLQPAGIPVKCVRTGEEALKLLSGPPPRALVLDGLLPGMRGDDLALRLRKVWGPKEVPILFVSAFFRDLRSRKRLLEECAVNAVLHKPVTPEDLRRALAQLPGMAPSAPESVDVPLDDLEDFELDLSTSVELLSDFLLIAAERMTALRDGLRNLTRKGGEAEAAKVIRNEAHKLRGTGGSFGLPEVTRLGGQLEDLMVAHETKPIDAQTRSAISGLIEALGTRLARAGAQAASPGAPSTVRHLEVALLDGPGDLAVSCGEAVAKGLPVRLFADVEAAIGSLTEQPADVTFVAVDRSTYDGVAAIQKLVDAKVDPVVAMSTDPSLKTRLSVIQHGASGYMHRLPDAASLLRMAPDFARPPKGIPVLAVGKDPSQLESVAQTLASQGFMVSPCLDPELLFTSLDEQDFSMLVVSSEMEKVPALRLVAAVRADVRYTQLPIIFLARGNSNEERLSAWESGADDVLPAPLNGPELIARTRARIRKHARALRKTSNEGSLPGFPGVLNLKEELARALDLAKRGRALSLLVFEGALRDLYAAKGRLETDAAVVSLGAKLKKAFRTSDFVASLGGARFGVLLHDAGRADAERLLTTTLERLNGSSAHGESVHVPVVAGLASYPEQSGGADALLEAAVTQLEGVELDDFDLI